MMSHEFRWATEAKEVVVEGLEELKAKPFCAVELSWVCGGAAALSTVDLVHIWTLLPTLCLHQRIAKSQRL